MSKKTVSISKPELNLPEIKPNEFGLDVKESGNLTIGLNIALKERESLIDEFEIVSKLELTEENLGKFKELRLRFVKNRTQGINKWHTASKSYFLNGGRFVDSIKNKENQINEAYECALLEGENYLENIEKEKLEKIKIERQSRLDKIELFNASDDILGMQDEIWLNYIEGAELKYKNDKIEKEKAAKEAKEKAIIDKLIQERKEKTLRLVIFIPNYNSIDFGTLSQSEFDLIVKNAKAEKLKADEKESILIAKNKKIKDDLAKSKRLIKELNDREVERQLKIKNDEIKRKKIEEQEAEKRKNAPDKEKITKLIKELALQDLEISNEKAINIYKDITVKFDSFKNWALKQIENL